MLSDYWNLPRYGLAVSVAIGLLAGCAAGPSKDAGVDEKDRVPLADSEAAFGYEQTDWGKPFWQRWIEQARAEAPAADAGATNQSAPAASAAPAAAVSSAPSMRRKLGVYIAREDRGTLAAYRLINALDERAAEHGFTLVKPDELDDAVGGTDACGAETALGCPGLLSIFPGARLLVVVDPASSQGERTTVETRMLDTDFGITYDTVSTELALASDSASDAAVWSERTLDTAADRAAIAPWFTHTFALNSDNDMYISAGSESGLAVDDTLVVHGEGAVVRAPGGQIVGWEPGPEVGRVRVLQFVGQDMAVAEQVSGRMPKPKDRLTIAD